MAEFRVGFIGCGNRGMGHLEGILTERDDTVVTWVCDVYEDRVAAAQKLLKDKKNWDAKGTTDYRKLIEQPDVDVVIISSAWDNHIPAAIYAMKCGKQVATEVGGAYDLDDCWNLVHTYEETGIQCFLLENCCYDRGEMMAMRMVRAGIFGDIVHCSGGYQHDLREEILYGKENRHYRLRNFKNRCCDNYPTHELGPIAKILDINRGNRLMTLTSMASGAWGLNEYARQHEDVNPEFRTYKFRQGDIIKTNIKCARGELITLTLDNTLPRNYSRNITIRGTKGFYSEDANGIFLDGMSAESKDYYNNMLEYRKTWDHPLWQDFEEIGIRGGHGGMDWLVFDAYFSSLAEGKYPPIDTYDTATWMAITPLSEKSINLGSVPLEIPDFTDGKWLERSEAETYRGKYELDK